MRDPRSNSTGSSHEGTKARPVEAQERFTVTQSIADPRPGRVHRVAKDTEIEAAASVTPITGRLRVQAYKLLKRYPKRGLTDDEGGALMGADRLTFGRRRQELVAEGLVKDSGVRRPGPSGRNAIVWVVA